MTGMVAEEREKVRPVAWARTNWQWIATAALCLLGVVNSWFLAIADRPSWNVDFNQFFVASKLAGTGELYNWDLLRSGQNQYHERAVPTGRLPVFPAIFKAISVFGYMPARIAWLLICAACALWAASVWPGADRKVLLILICWSLPLTIGLSFGQDSAVILAFFAAGLVLMHKKWDFAAGLVFSCMLLKFHLTAGVIVLVLARKAWRTVGGGIVGTAALLLASFGVEGRDWPNRWLAISRLPLFDPAPERMPNLRRTCTRIAPPNALVRSNRPCPSYICRAGRSSITARVCRRDSFRIQSHRGAAWLCIRWCSACAATWLYHRYD